MFVQNRLDLLYKPTTISRCPIAEIYGAWNLNCSTTQLSAPRSELNHCGALLFRRKFPQNRALAAFLSPVSDCLQRRFFHAFFALSETLILVFASVVEVTCPLPNKTVPCEHSPPVSQAFFQSLPLLRFFCRHPCSIVSCMGSQYAVHERTALKLLSSEPRLY